MDKAQPPFYRTLRGEGTAGFTEKKSRFAGYAAPALTEAAAAAFIEDIRGRHPDLSSLCWGYRCSPGGAVQRYHDDHEPSGGQPILEVLVRRELIGAAAVVRWFGGVKLGAGPLGRAFGRAAAMAVEAAGPCRADRSVRVRIRTDYGDAGAVERLLSQWTCRPEQTVYAEDVSLGAIIRQTDLEVFTARIADQTAGRARCTVEDTTYLCWEENPV